MFDRLIESDTTDFKPRRRYFIVSSLVVGLIFVSAVIFSIYAAEIGLGNDSFEISMIVAPLPPPEIAPEPPRPRAQNQVNVPKTELPERRAVFQRPEEIPVDIPPVSTTPNTQMTRPDTPYILSGRDTQPTQPATPQPGPATDNVAIEQPKTAPEVVSEPKPEAPKLPPVQSKGVINGMATSLPKPAYPAAAAAINLQGKVDVQVTIDETGKVISAKAASGPMFLRQAAESAAWRARFTPTYLSEMPVKVTGVIVYNFTRN